MKVSIAHVPKVLSVISVLLLLSSSVALAEPS